jgi:hypothetical protein
LNPAKTGSGLVHIKHERRNSMLKRLLLGRIGAESYGKLVLISLAVLGALIPVVVLGILSPTSTSAAPARQVAPDCADFTILGEDDVSDTLTGTTDDDIIAGQGGNDRITGLEGDDDICGGRGNDTINGGPGGDFLAGNREADTLQGGLGNDELFGGPGNDILNGGPGNDILNCGPGNNDTADGGPGMNVVTNCEN